MAGRELTRRGVSAPTAGDHQPGDHQPGDDSEREGGDRGRWEPAGSHGSGARGQTGQPVWADPTAGDPVPDRSDGPPSATARNLVVGAAIAFFVIALAGDTFLLAVSDRYPHQEVVLGTTG